MPSATPVLSRARRKQQQAANTQHRQHSHDDTRGSANWGVCAWRQAREAYWHSTGAGAGAAPQPSPRPASFSILLLELLSLLRQLFVLLLEVFLVIELRVLLAHVDLRRMWRRQPGCEKRVAQSADRRRNTHTAGARRANEREEEDDDEEYLLSVRDGRKRQPGGGRGGTARRRALRASRRVARGDGRRVARARRDLEHDTRHDNPTRHNTTQHDATRNGAPRDRVVTQSGRDATRREAATHARSRRPRGS